MTATDLLALLIVAGEWSGLTRALLGAPLYAAALDLLLIAAASAIAFRVTRQGGWRRRAGLPVLLVGGYAALAVVEMFNPNVPNLIVALEGLRKTAFATLAFFVVVFSPSVDRGAARRFFRIIAVGSIPAFLWALRQVILPLPIDDQIVATSGVSPITFHVGEVIRAYSPTSGPFHLGALAACVMVISLVEARHDSKWWLILALLAGLILGLTITRANIIAGIIALLAAALFAPTGRHRLMSLVYALPLAATVVVSALVASGALLVGGVAPPAGSALPSAAPPSAAQPSVTSPPTQSPSPNELADVVEGVLNPLSDKNLQFRLQYWSVFVRKIAEQPLIGYGTSSATDGFGAKYQGTSSQLFQPHSVYLKAALELGLGGLALLLAIFAWMAVTVISLVRTHPAIALTCGGILTIVGISGISGPMLDAYPFNLLFWGALGWVVALRGGRASASQIRMRSAEASRH